MITLKAARNLKTSAADLLSLSCLAFIINGHHKEKTLSAEIRITIFDMRIVLGFWLAEECCAVLLYISTTVFTFDEEQAILNGCVLQKERGRFAFKKHQINFPESLPELHRRVSKYVHCLHFRDNFASILVE